MGLSLPKSNLIFLKKCLDKWVHFNIQEIKRGFEKLLFLYSEKFTQNAIMVLWNIRLKIIYFLEREKVENLFGRY